MAGPGAFLTAQWRWLAMVNFEVDPALVKPLAPRGTEIDYFNGRTYVSLVGFLFLDTRVLGFPIPFHRDFEEVNLRFYTRHKAAEGWRRGVTFVREIVPRAAIAWTAKALYNEPYAAMPMRHSLSPGAVTHEWRHAGRWNRIDARYEGEPQPLERGSEAEFITEHYWGYTAQRDGGTVEYRVEHPSWRVWTAPRLSYQVDGEGLYGREFGAVMRQQPTSAFLAEGSGVTVYRGVAIGAANR